MTTEQTEYLLKNYPTPFYVFEEKPLLDRVKYLKSKLPEGIKLCYAVKANTFISPLLCKVVDRYEVCSSGEIAICKEQDIEPEKLVISGVYKEKDIIEKHVCSDDCAGRYTAESPEQYTLLKNAAQKANKKIKLLLRLTSGNQFGMNEEDIEKIIAEKNDETYTEICGIQFFSGTQKTSVKKYKRELTRLDEFLKKLNLEFGFAAEELEYGTGFPVSYFEGEKLDEDALLDEFSELLSSLEYKGNIILEVGRSIAACCGSYFTKAVDVKTNSSQNYAIMDGGIHHIAYFGQFMAMKHPYIKLFPERTGEKKEWNLCGSLCTVNDLLVKSLPISDFKAGDTVIFQNTGAYCATEGISLFLSHALPSVIILDSNGKCRLCRGAFETYTLNH